MLFEVCAYILEKYTKKFILFFLLNSDVYIYIFSFCDFLFVFIFSTIIKDNNGENEEHL